VVVLTFRSLRSCIVLLALTLTLLLCCCCFCRFDNKRHTHTHWHLPTMIIPSYRLATLCIYMVNFAMAWDSFVTFLCMFTSYLVISLSLSLSLCITITLQPNTHCLMSEMVRSVYKWLVGWLIGRLIQLNIEALPEYWKTNVCHNDTVRQTTNQYHISPSMLIDASSAHVMSFVECSKICSIVRYCVWLLQFGTIMLCSVPRLLGRQGTSFTTTAVTCYWYWNVCVTAIVAYDSWGCIIMYFVGYRWYASAHVLL
jgi:hypothetical protein